MQEAPRRETLDSKPYLYFDVNRPEDREKTNNKDRNMAFAQFGVEVLTAEGGNYSERYEWALDWIEGKLKEQA